MSQPFETLLATRYSCRAYKPDPVDTDTIRAIVATAGRVPSWCNAQPWQVVVTTGDTTAALSTALLKSVQTGVPAPDLSWPAQYTGAYRNRRFDCGMQLYDAIGIARDDKAARYQQMLENYRFFGAPHLAVITTEADLGPYGAMDCGGFVAAFTLACTDHGLGSIAQASVAAYPNVLRCELGIPENRHILCGISFGHPDHDQPINRFRTARADVDDVLEVK